jgi:hypothetical protein
MHYFALLIVPLAIARPRIHAVWALPVLLFACGSRSSAAWQIEFVFAVVGTMLAFVVRRRGGSIPDVRVAGSGTALGDPILATPV